jgi:hypothetical protein
MAIEHLARDLSVPGLVSADQSKSAETVEEEEGTESGEEQDIGARASSHEGKYRLAIAD